MPMWKPGRSTKIAAESKKLQELTRILNFKKGIKRELDTLYIP